MAQKQSANRDQGETVSRVYVPPVDITADINRVLDILKSLPMLRRYGDDASALKEAQEILEKVRGKL